MIGPNSDIPHTEYVTVPKVSRNSSTSSWVTGAAPVRVDRRLETSRGSVRWAAATPKCMGGGP